MRVAASRPTVRSRQSGRPRPEGVRHDDRDGWSEAGASVGGKGLWKARSLLAPEVEFRALTPQRTFEAEGVEEATAVLELWYADADTAEIEALECAEVVDRPALTYRIRWTKDEDAFVFEQGAFYDLENGKVSRIHIVCSGDRPLVESA